MREVKNNLRRVVNQDFHIQPYDVNIEGQKEDILKYSRIQNIPPRYHFPNKLNKNPCLKSETITNMNSTMRKYSAIYFFNVYKC